MGEVEVMVGCPHKVRSPIGSRTKYPCAACAPFGPPGWPRWAIAMTVDYGPRLSAGAVKGVARTPEPPAPVRPVVTAQTLADAARALRNVVVAHPTLVQSVALEPGDLNVVMHEQTDADFRANVIRFEAVQQMRLRRR